jgi:hypothetical protein
MNEHLKLITNRAATTEKCEFDAAYGSSIRIAASAKARQSVRATEGCHGFRSIPRSATKITGFR